MSSFRAFEVAEVGEKQYQGSVIEKTLDSLAENEVLVRVNYSCLNFKDALSASGSKGVTRNYPHTPGIDAVGVVEKSSVESFSAGDEVIVSGYDLGMNTSGGFGQYISVPAAWVLPLPGDMTALDSMCLGTAGLTAALCIEKLLASGLTKDRGNVLVTGATGGVGIVAVMILAKLGFAVVASTGKENSHQMLRDAGASEIIDRKELNEVSPQPLLKEQWAAAVDVVGGDTLFNVIKGLQYGGSVAACGLVQSPVFQASVLPFILRGVNLLGIDSVELPLDKKAQSWARLASEWKVDNLASICTEISLAELDTSLKTVLHGGAIGRFVLNLNT